MDVLWHQIVHMVGHFTAQFTLLPALLAVEDLHKGREMRFFRNADFL